MAGVRRPVLVLSRLQWKESRSRSGPGSRVLRTVGKAPCRRPQSAGAQDRAVRDRSQRDHDAAGPQCGQFALEIAVALPHFGRQRLVAGRQAFHGVRDAAVDELEPVIGADRLGARGKSVRMQRAIQEDARMVAGERPTRAVRTVQAGRKPDDESR